MRIAQVITIGHEMYGAQKHVLDLAIAFKKEGHDVLVIMGSTGALDQRCEQAGIAWKQVASLRRPIRPLTDLKACRELKEVLSAFDAEIVASHSSKAGIISRWVCYRMGIPNTFTAHGWSFEDGVPPLRRSMYKLVEKAVGRISNKIITVSNLGEELALQQKVVAPDKLEMIYYGTEDIGANYEKNKQPVFTMSMVAGFREQKDHETLVRALGQLKDRSWQIYFLGDGPLRPGIEQLVEQLGISDKVHFEGMVDNVPEYLTKTDVLVLITKWEGLPISTLEGLTFSLPVVASDVSGVREQVINDYNGLTVKRGDVADVARAIEYVLDHPEKLDEYAANSRKLYLENFTDEVMFQKTKTLYESLVNHQTSNSK